MKQAEQMRSKNLEVPRAEGKTKSPYVVEELWEGNEDLEEMTTEELEEELIEVKEGWTNERVEFEVQRRKNEVLRRQLLEREKDERQAGSRQSNPPDRLGVAAPAKRPARQPAKESARPSRESKK
jgi:ribosomal protein L29